MEPRGGRRRFQDLLTPREGVSGGASGHLTTLAERTRTRAWPLLRLAVPTTTCSPSLSERLLCTRASPIVPCITKVKPLSWTWGAPSESVERATDRMLYE